MDPLNICVIGCGDIFQISHIEHWERNPHSRIYSVVDIDPDVARAAADKENIRVRVLIAGPVRAQRIVMLSPK